MKASRCFRGYWYAVAAAGQSRYAIKVTVASTQSTCAVGSVAKVSDQRLHERAQQPTRRRDQRSGAQEATTGRTRTGRNSAEGTWATRSNHHASMANAH